MSDPDFIDEDLEIVYNDLDDDISPVIFNGIEEDEYGHAWTMGWEDTEKPHPGFGGSTDIYGCYTDQCAKCGMYGYEFQSLTDTLGKYEGQICGKRIR
jgi:hypothetical protein